MLKATRAQIDEAWELVEKLGKDKEVFALVIEAASRAQLANVIIDLRKELEDKGVMA